MTDLEIFVINLIDDTSDYDFWMTWENARENVKSFRAENRADPEGFPLPDGMTVASFRSTWNRLRGGK